MDKKVVYAIVVTYNPDIHLLEAEYHSISSQVDLIIYVDNGSENCADIKKWSIEKDKLSFIWLEDNEGLGVAQNAGIKRALDAGVSHIIIFDQDSVVAEDFVNILLSIENKAISEGIKVGLTGPVYRSYEDDYTYPVWSVDNGKLIKIPQKNINVYRTVTHIIASGSLIRREVLLEVGLMREDFFLGFIDYEYCFRAAQYGYKAIVTNKACMYHKMGDSQIVIHGSKIGLYSPFRRYFDCRNTFLIQREKSFPKVVRRYYLKLIFGKVIISLLYGPKRWQQFKYCLYGFYDGILGKTGNCCI